MSDAEGIAGHWAQGDVLGLVLAAMERAGLDPGAATVETLAPIDHFHARGFAATRELADALPVSAEDRLLDIGCGLGGPARYFAERFGCRVDGIDITEPFVVAAARLTALTGLEDRVAVRLGDGERLPYADVGFDGAFAQHVTMNVADRAAFFAEAFRVLKPGGFFALTEHGLGATGGPHHPVPWSETGAGAYLVTPEETARLLGDAGFEGVEMTETGEKSLEGYRAVVGLAERGALPPFGVHLLMGATAPAKLANAARNIAEGRTRPIQVLCRRPL